MCPRDTLWETYSSVYTQIFWQKIDKSEKRCKKLKLENDKQLEHDKQLENDKKR